MDHDDVLALFDRQLRRDVRADSVSARVERDGAVVRQVGEPHDWNGVLWSDVDEASADRVIAEQVRYFGALGREFEWKVYAHDRPADLGKRLAAAGFEAEPEEAVMVAEVADQAAEVALPEGIHLRPVTDAAGVDLVTEVHEQAFGTSSALLRRRLLEQLAADTGTFSMVVAMDGDVPVSSARMEVNEGTEFAGLWGGGTVAAWRGRGLYRALVAHRARLAADLGHRYLQVDASDDSRPILQRLGFTLLTTTTPCVRRPDAQGRRVAG
ncbi:GNAT family N-acetyltransferase [Streptomyces triticagri]|uniref:GNAT family N-acetyltransferase n=1 Tax=Streptomyces triticagri TaxID=2293568 RepID=A0A372M5X3_9ACTN|nr:GNAT family N-acetyltransferase [Streptomyces triticagri]RFU85945.1 GNAT family N-acetyltransferase [Streptomyces triticagri]